MVMNYQGTELELFAAATNWKDYWSQCVSPYARGVVIEVGAGIGTSTPYICGNNQIDRCICLEPDPAFARELSDMIVRGALPSYCEAKCGILSDLPASLRADAIFYIDVLEHIEDDVGELRLAAERLSPGSKLVVLSPAFQFLYSPFDKAIGHHRRYSRRDLGRLTVPGLILERHFYLDSLGMMLSMANRLLLRFSVPTKGQIKFWDKTVLPVSRYLDRLLNRVCGRSIVMVWRKA